MMHTLRNRKTGRKSARRRFTEARRTFQTAVYPHFAGAIWHSNSSFRAFLGFKTRVWCTHLSQPGVHVPEFSVKPSLPTCVLRLVVVLPNGRREPPAW